MHPLRVFLRFKSGAFFKIRRIAFNSNGFYDSSGHIQIKKHKLYLFQKS